MFKKRWQDNLVYQVSMGYGGLKMWFSSNASNIFIPSLSARSVLVGVGRKDSCLWIKKRKKNAPPHHLSGLQWHNVSDIWNLLSVTKHIKHGNVRYGECERARQISWCCFFCLFGLMWKCSTGSCVVESSKKSIKSLTNFISFAKLWGTGTQPSYMCLVFCFPNNKSLHLL